MYSGARPPLKKMPRYCSGSISAERDVGLDGVAFPLLGDGPARLHLVHDHLVAALLGSGHHRLEAGFDQPVVGIKRVDGFGSVAHDHQDATGRWRVQIF